MLIGCKGTINIRIWQEFLCINLHICEIFYTFAANLKMEMVDGKKILVLAGKSAPKIFRDDRLSELLNG